MFCTFNLHKAFSVYLEETAECFIYIFRCISTIKDFQENLPVGRNADVFFVDVVIQKHCAWILPCLFPEANPNHRNKNKTLHIYIFS